MGDVRARFDFCNNIQGRCNVQVQLYHKKPVYYQLCKNAKLFPLFLGSNGTPYPVFSS